MQRVIFLFIRRDFVTNRVFVYSCIRVFVYSCIRLFVYSCIRVFGETSSLMVYSLFRVPVISSGFYFAFLKLNKNCIEIPIILLYDYTTIRPFVYSCIRRDFVSNGVFVISCTCHIEWFLLCFFEAN
jgi:hypothetical protein